MRLFNWFPIPHTNSSNLGSRSNWFGIGYVWNEWNFPTQHGCQSKSETCLCCIFFFPPQSDVRATSFTLKWVRMDAWMYTVQSVEIVSNCRCVISVHQQLYRDSHSHNSIRRHGNRRGSGTALEVAARWPRAAEAVARWRWGCTTFLFSLCYGN